MSEENVIAENPIVEPATETVKEPDLEQIRDEKCLPIARGVLNDMAEDLIAEDSKPLVMKILARTLEADLNISTDSSYIFQLALSSLSVLNTAVQTVESEPLDDDRYNDIAKKLLVIIATADLPMNNISKETVEEISIPVKDRVRVLFAEEKLNKLEIKHIIEKIFNSFTAINNSFSESLAQSSARAEAKLFGIDSMNDLTMKKLNDVLVS